MIRQQMVFLAAQPDVQIIAFAETPAIPLEIPAEVQLWRIAADLAFKALQVIHLELDLLGSNGRLVRTEFRAHETRHRAEMSACADDQRRRDCTIDDPLPAISLQGFQRLAQTQTRTRALQQIVVQFAAAYAVADCVRITGLHLFPVYQIRCGMP